MAAFGHERIRTRIRRGYVLRITLQYLLGIGARKFGPDIGTCRCDGLSWHLSSSFRCSETRECMQPLLARADAGRVRTLKLINRRQTNWHARGRATRPSSGAGRRGNPPSRPETAPECSAETRMCAHFSFEYSLYPDFAAAQPLLLFIQMLPVLNAKFSQPAACF